MKRTFIFSVFTLALMMLCQSAFAYDYYVNGIYYRKVTQQLPGGGCGETILIVVNDDYENTYSGDIVIPEAETINGESYRVTYIGSEAFYGCVNLTSVTLPNTIVNIGYHSFASCPLLEYIELPAGMKQINSNAFSNCDELDYIFIHDTEPFFLWDDAFADINDHVHIVVPCNCIEAFEAAEEWQGILLYDDCGNVGVGETETAAVNVYPNPAHEAVSIHSEDGIQRITVNNFLGQQVEAIELNGSNHFVLNTSDYATGTYIVNITTEKGIATKRLVVR